VNPKTPQSSIPFSSWQNSCSPIWIGEERDEAIHVAVVEGSECQLIEFRNRLEKLFG
jgi:hypothetical protein